MNSFYLLEYIKSNFKFDGAKLDAIKYELDKHIYYYGDQFKYPVENHSKTYLLKEQVKKKIRLFNFLRAIVRKPSVKKSKRIVSNAYFSTNNELAKIGYQVYNPPWTFRANNSLTHWSFWRFYQYFDKVFSRGNVNEIISNTFLSQIDDFKEFLQTYYLQNEFDALFVPNDISFYENLSIQVFAKLNRPSFVFLHGIPGRYNNIDENRSKFLVVWGDKIKENYVKAGFDREKILVSGHPSYKEIPLNKLIFNSQEVLVLSKSMNGGQHSDRHRYSDRGNSVFYIYSVQSVLQRFGITKARLRLHPSENLKWYRKFVDTSFFEMDISPISNSLSSSSLVIGPTSTVLLEAIFRGTNYIVYEPLSNGLDLFNFPLVPPFDGENGKVPLATTEDELLHLLRNKALVDYSILKEYIQTPFSLDFLGKYI